MKFLLTPELGRLATWLRALGYDAVIFQGEIPDLLAKATFEKRIVVTRQGALRGHRGTPVVRIAQDRVEKQLLELKKSRPVRLSPSALFHRCLRCNVPVKPITKGHIKKKVPPYVFKTQKVFSHCPVCRRIYWTATHRDRAERFLKNLRRPS